jgi:hypothetical protein
MHHLSPLWGSVGILPPRRSQNRNKSFRASTYLLSVSLNHKYTGLHIEYNQCLNLTFASPSCSARSLPSGRACKKIQVRLLKVHASSAFLDTSLTTFCASPATPLAITIPFRLNKTTFKCTNIVMSLFRSVPVSIRG